MKTAPAALTMRPDPPYPRLRIVAIVWMAIYLPAYTSTYGVGNFLNLCNLGLFVTAAGWILGHPLLVSSQAVASPIIGIAWGLDAGWRLLTGAHLYGATAYMWDPQYPLAVRLLSLYHLAWPIALLWCVRRSGYDRRAPLVQAGLAAFGLVAARLLTSPEANINFAFRDPFFGAELGPPALHLAAIWIALVGVVYALTHAVLKRTCPPPGGDPAAASDGNR